MIRNNAYKYSISAMCEVLEIPSSTFYYKPVKRPKEDDLIEVIQTIFKASRNNYGTRKIKFDLKKIGWMVSRRRIGRIMKEQGLVSNYTVAQFKPLKTKVNEEFDKNELNRQFDNQKELAVVVSDLTYGRVNGKWHYICLFVDLFNREMIGHSSGLHKTAEFVYKAIASVRRPLDAIQMFHTDRGSEFKNHLIDEVLETFSIKRSLSMRGCSYDNTVAEAMFKVIKTEFTNGAHFNSLEQLELELNDYVHWFNNLRIHGTLDYKTPMEYRLMHIK